MFIVDNMKVTFKRERMWVFVVSLKETVKRDVTICRIFDTTTSKRISTGISVLNPVDSNNKMIGKKIALTKAIKQIERPIRHKIWSGFWKWVSMWSSLWAMRVNNMLEGWDVKEKK